MQKLRLCKGRGQGPVRPCKGRVQGRLLWSQREVTEGPYPSSRCRLFPLFKLAYSTTSSCICSLPISSPVQCPHSPIYVPPSTPPSPWILHNLFLRRRLIHFITYPVPPLPYLRTPFDPPPPCILTISSCVGGSSTSSPTRCLPTLLLNASFPLAPHLAYSAISSCVGGSSTSCGRFTVGATADMLGPTPPLMMRWAYRSRGRQCGKCELCGQCGVGSDCSTFVLASPPLRMR